MEFKKSNGEPKKSPTLQLGKEESLEISEKMNFYAATETTKSTINNQQSTINNQQSTINNQQSTINNSQAAISDQRWAEQFSLSRGDFSAQPVTGPQLLNWACCHEVFDWAAKGLRALRIGLMAVILPRSFGLSLTQRPKSWRRDTATRSGIQTVGFYNGRYMLQLLPRLFSGLPSWILAMLALALALPVLAVLGSWFQWSSENASILLEMARTVLPDYALTTLGLCLMVAAGVTALGLTTAALVTLFDFPGRGALEWLLLLPLAMPAYVVAYAYTDFLQFSGPVQVALREWLGLQGRLWPDVRSVWGAALVFTLSLYPYVYLLARTALVERASGLMEAARLLGAPLTRRIREIALPLARPAVAAGVALALMETLADYGVSSYFGVQTFTAGIYKAWLSMDNRIAAAQLATVLLAVVVVLLQLEQRAQKRMRFDAGRGTRQGSAEAQPMPLRGMRCVLAWGLCSLPVLLGFVLPVLIMLRALMGETTEVPWERFGHWAWTSLRLGAATAVLAVGVALALSFSVRTRADRISQSAIQLVGLGYAIPGAVVVVGLLLPLGWIQQIWPASSAGAWITATSLGLVWAYLVRFCAVALQSVQSGYARIPTSLDDSARMLGVTGWGLMRRVHAPLLQRTTIAAALLVFVDVMKELPATMVLRPFNSDTLAVVAYQLARDERLGEAALPSLALVLVGLIPVILLSRTLRQRP